MQVRPTSLWSNRSLYSTAILDHDVRDRNSLRQLDKGLIQAFVRREGMGLTPRVYGDDCRDLFKNGENLL
jgi:hypothetical protein